MRTAIWLVRHGQTELNRQRRYQGHSESELTAFGRQQVGLLAQRLLRQPLNLLLCSPRSHAQATASLLVQQRALAPQIDPRWTEINHGRWEGLTWREVRERYPQEAAARFAAGIHGRAEGGESLAEVQQRVLAAWHELLAQHTGKRVLIVTHATPIQLLLCHITGMPLAQHWQWRVDLGSLTGLDVYAATPIIRIVNWHGAGALSTGQTSRKEPEC